MCFLIDVFIYVSYMYSIDSTITGQLSHMIEQVEIIFDDDITLKSQLPIKKESSETRDRFII